MIRALLPRYPFFAASVGKANSGGFGGVVVTWTRRAYRPRVVRVLVAGTGRVVEVWAVPLPQSVERAVRRAHGLEGRAACRRGAWTLTREGDAAPARKSGLLLSRERHQALEEQYPGWLAGLGARVQLRHTASGVWVDSAEDGLLRELRGKADEALG